MNDSEKIAILNEQPIGTVGVDDEGDRWEKVSANAWDCPRYGISRNPTALIRDYPDFYEHFLEVVSKNELRAVLVREINLSTDDPLGRTRKELLQGLLKDFGLKQKRKIRVTLELEVDDDGVWDERRVAEEIPFSTPGIVALITNIEEVK